MKNTFLVAFSSIEVFGRRGEFSEGCLSINFSKSIWEQKELLTVKH